MTREDDLALVLSIALAAATGLIYDGAVVDEQGLLGVETLSSPAALVDRGFTGALRGASEVLEAIASG